MRNQARSAWRSRSCTKAPEWTRSRQMASMPPIQQKRAQLTPVPTLAAYFKPRKRNQIMEPGGIEPPCRDCQQDTSTSVVVGLISILHRATTPCPSIQPLETSSPTPQETPSVGQPENRDSPPYRASSGESTANQAASAYCGSADIKLRTFYEANTLLDSPHQTFPIRSNAISAPSSCHWTAQQHHSILCQSTPMGSYISQDSKKKWICQSRPKGQIRRLL